MGTNKNLIPASALALVLLAGCSSDGAENGGMGGFPPPEVNIEMLVAKDIPINREYVAESHAYREVQVRAQVGGILQTRRFEEGQQVKKGQVLFVLDQKPFRIALASANAQKAEARARLMQAEREFKRVDALRESKLVSQRDLDTAQSTLEAAQAAMQAAEASVNEAELNLGYTEVKAPIDGVISLTQKHEGALVGALNDVLTTIVQIDPMYVYFNVSETESLRHREAIAEGRIKSEKGEKGEVQIRLANGQLLAQTGELDYTDVSVTENAGTVLMRAKVPNPDRRLIAGQFVRVVLNGAYRSEAISVPQKSVLEGPQGKFVYIVEKDATGNPVAAMRQITAGDWYTEPSANNEQRWIIDSGLQAGDQLILDNLIKIQPGAPVSIATPAT